MPALALFARDRETITVTLGGDVGETAWEIEVNRSADFNADESYFHPCAAAANFGVHDLVPDTPYYFRARKVNGGPGPWCAVLMAATLPPAAAAVPAYVGFSVVPAILVVPEPIAELSATNLAAGSDADNLLNDDPMSVLHIDGDSSVIEFRTTGRAIDTFALLGTLANESVTWRIRGAATYADVTAAPVVDTGAVQLRAGSGIGRRQHYHGFRRLGQAYELEYWRIDLAGFLFKFMARNLVIGFARSSVNISQGQGYEPNDAGTIARTQFGQPDRVRGWRGRKVEFPLSWLREAEYEAKWRDLDHLVGTTDPVLALPNPKASRYLNDRIAFGEITTMRSELVRGDRYNRSVEIRSLY